jgi:EAL domain-containing protein (putative c-di-GMP-specific phosphodiesterase class I)
MMSLWDALRMNMMISYQELVRTFPSLIRCCELLEIRICATGVEQTEEWMWLESAGIFCFQGNLFQNMIKMDI